MQVGAERSQKGRPPSARDGGTPYWKRVCPRLPRQARRATQEDVEDTSRLPGRRDIERGGLCHLAFGILTIANTL